MRRLGRMSEYLITVWLILTLNILLPKMMPGDPFLMMSAESHDAPITLTQEQRDYYAHHYGLDRPLGQWYLAQLSNLIHGQLGESIYYGEPVARLIIQRLPWTVFLMISALLCTTILGTALGAFSAFYRNKKPDQLLYGIMICVSDIPAFLLGLILLFVFAAQIRLFPLSGAMTLFSMHSSIVAHIFDILHHAVLPICALTLARLGGMYLLARNTLITILCTNYMRTAKAKNLSRFRIVFHHAIRNALLPIFTRLFLSLGTLLGGAILVENVFSYPGLGTLIREAVTVHDYPLIQGLFLCVTLLVLSANALAEWVYARLDPRVGQKVPRLSSMENHGRRMDEITITCRAFFNQVKDRILGLKGIIRAGYRRSL